MSQFDPVLFFFPATISAVVAVFAWQYRSHSGGKPLIIHAVGSVVWILSYGAGTRLNSQLIAPGMLGVSWLAAVVVAVSGMYVAAEYTDRPWLEQPLILGGIGGYLCLEALLIGLNPGNLFYTRAPTVVQSGPPVYEFGVWWVVHLIVVFGAATAMLGMFLEAYFTDRETYRQQARTILFGIAISVIAASIEVFGLEPYPDLLYNTTMAGTTVLSVTFLWALFYTDFLDVTPVGRRALLEDVEDATFVLDEQDRLVYANRVARDLFDTGPEYVGMSIDESVIPPTDGISDQFTDVTKGETELAITTDSGKRYFSVSSSTVNSGGRRRAFVLHETTAERTYRLQIEQQRDNLEMLNQVLRHDIRNDLQLVSGYVDLLDKTCETEDEQEYIDTITESTDHAIELTQTGRELSEVMLSETVKQERVDLQPILEDEAAEVQASYPGADLAFGTEVPSATLATNEMVSSVFRNLLKNAIQHNNKEVPEVVVSTNEHEKTITIQIADNGPGVSEGQKDRIFGKGEQGLDSSGTGMGLYLVDTLVSIYDGEVWIEDNEPEGAIFSVELPTV
jgi:signal transduction histidine kinase